MHVDDFPDALIEVAKKYDSDEPINVGTGKEISISNLAKFVKNYLITRAR